MLLEENGILNKKTLKALNKKGIYTYDDLVRWVPRRYKDYSEIKALSSCVPGTECAVAGVLRRVEKKDGQRKYLSLKIEPDVAVPGVPASVSVIIFSRVFLFRALYALIGERVVVAGRLQFDAQWGYSVAEPDEVELYSDFVPGIRPVYKKIGGVSEQMLKKLIDMALSKAHEPFEWELMNVTGAVDYKTALTCIHHPENLADVARGERRLLLNDMLYFSIGLKKTAGVMTDTAVTMKDESGLISFLSSLPFLLTEDQDKAVHELAEKMMEGRRVNALLQGDVGSGKTVVALALMVHARSNGIQSVLMAPREVLAAQHLRTVLVMTGLSDLDVVFLHSGMKRSERKEALKKVSSGEASFIIGTHSCIAQDVVYKNLGLVVTDEEHLFGVRQKEAIREKACAGAHVISMSATPIPRSLASVLYGEDKTICQIRSMPAGRLPVKTAIVSERDRVMRFLLSQIRDGRQCYIVCPAIEDDENGDLVSIERIEGDYRAFLEPYGVKVAVANGKMKKEESDEAVRRFASGEYHVLLSTTVIEVGVNVPNATVIVIEQADRFGLSSLHQLRGRVGRGSHQSYCVLLTEDLENPRLKAIQKTTDGFLIAEEDLKLRGTGNLLGTEQAGQNRYIELMLSHPDVFAYTQKIASFCMENSFGERLFSIYFEHLAAEDGKH